MKQVTVSQRVPNTKFGFVFQNQAFFSFCVQKGQNLPFYLEIIKSEKRIKDFISCFAQQTTSKMLIKGTKTEQVYAMDIKLEKPDHLKQTTKRSVTSINKHEIKTLFNFISDWQ